MYPSTIVRNVINDLQYSKPSFDNIQGVISTKPQHVDDGGGPIYVLSLMQKNLDLHDSQVCHIPYQAAETGQIPQISSSTILCIVDGWNAYGFTCFFSTSILLKKFSTLAIDVQVSLAPGL